MAGVARNNPCGVRQAVFATGALLAIVLLAHQSLSASPDTVTKFATEFIPPSSSHASFAAADALPPATDVPAWSVRDDVTASCATGRKPNIVIILSDDQGYGDTAHYNPKYVRTPTWDRMASMGSYFPDAHSGASVCTPSRFALLTGQYAFRIRPEGGVIEADHWPLIDATRKTLGDTLRGAGYATYYSGKWHLGMNFAGGKSWRRRDWTQEASGGPYDRGFDEYFGIPASMNHGVLTYMHNRMVLEPPTLFTTKTDLEHSICPHFMCKTFELEKPYGDNGYMEVAPSFEPKFVLENVTRRAREFVYRHAAQRPQQPFFLFVALTAPHHPVAPHPEFVGRSPLGLYGDFIEETDHRTGQVLHALSEAGVLDDTLVIFTSDNGPELIRKQLKREGYSASGPLRDGKRSLYEGGHRVPFIAMWPEGIPRNVENRHTIAHVDMLASLAELTNAPRDANDDKHGPDSHSVWRQLCDPSAPPVTHPLLHESSKGRIAIRQGAFKLLVDSGELFDLSRDVTEKKSVAAQEKERVKRMRATAVEMIGYDPELEHPTNPPP